MHSRLNLHDLFSSRIPCSASSVLFPTLVEKHGQMLPRDGNADETVASALHRTGLDTQVRDREDVLGRRVHGSPGKRKRGALGASSSVKKQRSGLELLQVSREPRFLVGRLQLCNRSANPQLQACPITVDCLTFTDETASVCCTVASLDPRMLGQLVQVDSWTFLPVTSCSSHGGARTPEGCCTANAGAKASDQAALLYLASLKSGSKKTFKHVNSVLGSFDCSGGTLNAGGCLEIRNLKLLAGSSAPSMQMPNFPALCLSPAAADIRNHTLESPLIKKGAGKPRLRLSGLLDCMSPPFVLPCNEPSRRAAAGEGVSCNGPQKSLFRDEGSSGKRFGSQNMLGFFVELWVCPHSPSCDFDGDANRHQCHLLKIPSVAHVVDRQDKEIAQVYFSGSVAAWRPMLSQALGKYVAITGLRKKVILVGPERKQYSIFVATRISMVSMLCAPELGMYEDQMESSGCCRTHSFHQAEKKEDGLTVRRSGRNLSYQLLEPFSKELWGSKEGSDLRAFSGACVDNDCVTTRHCNSLVTWSTALIGTQGCMKHGGRKLGLVVCNPPGINVLGVKKRMFTGASIGSYVGIVTGIHMQGQLVELDKRVWLLLTHYTQTQVHGLRVGAMVSVRHAHIIALESVWERVLLLGPCFRSHVAVVLFSGLNTLPVMCQPLKTRLGKCLENLPFVSAFWALQVIASLRRKLEGVYSDKQLLGWKKDMFKEFFVHTQSCHLGEDISGRLLAKVPPISNFCVHIEALWLDPHSIVWRRQCENLRGGSETESRWTSSLGLQTKKKETPYVRRIISGAELGVVLIGSLKVCQTSGKLQLVDSTGALDVIVPDLHSQSNLHCLYEVSNFSLVLEGLSRASPAPTTRWNVDRPEHSPLSSSNILKGVISENKLSKRVACYYVHFHLRHATCLRSLRWPSETLNNNGNSRMVNKCAVDQGAEDLWKGKHFHIVMVTHKHHVRLKHSVKQKEGYQWTFCAEAVVLPYRILLHTDSTAPDVCADLPLSRGDGGCGSVATDLRERKEKCMLGTCKVERKESAKEASAGSKEDDECTIRWSVPCLLKHCSGESAKCGPVSIYRGLVERNGRLKNNTGVSCEMLCCKDDEEGLQQLAASDLERIVLEFNGPNIEYSQVLHIGQCYLHPLLRSDLSTPAGSCGDQFQSSSGPVDSCQHSADSCLSFTKLLTVDASRPLLSFSLTSFEDCGSSEVNGFSGACEVPSITTLGRHGEQVAEVVELPGKAESLTLNSRDEAELPHSRGSQKLPGSRNPILATLICHQISSSELASVSSALEGVHACMDSPNEEVKTNQRTMSQLSNAILMVPKALEEGLKHKLASLRAQLGPSVWGVKGALDHVSLPVSLSTDKFGQQGSEILEKTSDAESGETCTRVFALQGALVSVMGRVESIEPLAPCPSFARRELLKLRKPCSSSRSMCPMEHEAVVLEVQDLHGPQMIKVKCNFAYNVCPVGLGPGAVISFHRILLQRGPTIQLQSIATTLFIVHSIQESLPYLSKGGQCLRVDRSLAFFQEQDSDSLDVVDTPNQLDLLCSLTHHQSLRLHCRVVDVQRLELQWQGSPLFDCTGSDDRQYICNESGSFPSNCKDELQCVIATSGCFTIDDGSSLADCWATGRQAAGLLRLASLSRQGQLSSTVHADLLNKIIHVESAMGTSIDQVLCALVQKHGQISVHRELLWGDVGNNPWLMESGGGETLAGEEQVIMSVILQQACQMGPLVVQCTVIPDIEDTPQCVSTLDKRRAFKPAILLNNGRRIHTVTRCRSQLVAKLVESTNNWRELESLCKELRTNSVLQNI